MKRVWGGGMRGMQTWKEARTWGVVKASKHKLCCHACMAMVVACKGASGKLQATEQYAHTYAVGTA